MCMRQLSVNATEKRHLLGAHLQRSGEMCIRSTSLLSSTIMTCVVAMLRKYKVPTRWPLGIGCLIDKGNGKMGFVALWVIDWYEVDGEAIFKYLL